MVETITFKSLDEKHLLCEVQSMFWSPKMDLISVSTLSGEVILYRLSLHKVWTVKKLDDGPLILSMAWRFDGKILAVAYSNNRIQLRNVENGELLHSFDVGGKIYSSSICFLSWSPELLPVDKKQTGCNFDAVLDELNFEYDLKSSSEEYMPPLLEFSKSEYNVNTEFKNIKSEKLSLLIVADSSGCICLYGYGIILLTTIQLPKMQRVLSATFSTDFASLSVAASDNENSPTFQKLYLYDTSIMKNYSKEINKICSSFGYLWYLEHYVLASIEQMKELLEEIVLEMDLKINKFAEEKYKRGKESVRKDFLMLFVYGKASDELKDFLQHDLTTQSLNKLASSIENSYSNIQNLLSKHLENVIQRMSYELSELKGLGLIADRYDSLGIKPLETNAAIDMAGSFMLKSVELQQVIESSMETFKAFFHWLAPIKKMFSSESTPPTKTNQQKTEFVARFINDNFKRPDEPDKQKFKLEKVGQYLENKDLSSPCSSSSNSWQKLLNEKNSLANHPLIYKLFPEKSLVQLHAMLTKSINDIITNCSASLSKSISLTNSVNFAIQNVTRISPITQILSPDSDEILTTFSISTLTTQAAFCVIKQNCQTKDNYLSAMKLVNIEDFEFLKILDLKFFSPSILVKLVQAWGPNESENGENQCFVSQIYLPTIRYVPVVGDLSLHDSSFQPVYKDVKHEPLIACSNIKPIELVVSGARKTACVLFASRRRIKLFLAEDGDDLIMQINQSLDQLEAIHTGLADPIREVDQIMDDIDNENKENTFN